MERESGHFMKHSTISVLKVRGHSGEDGTSIK